MFKKLSVKSGFTETEIKVLIFLLGLFLAGFIYVKFIKGEVESTYKKFDYSNEENLLIKSWQDDSLEAFSSLETDTVKNNVLELNGRRNEVTAKKEIREKSINLNTATKGDLITIKGIGLKTAETIITFRENNGKFGSLNDLMKIKGIGAVKYRQFSKYLYIK